MSFNNPNRALNPKGVCLWLKFHTKLSKKQIADFCQMSIMAVDAIGYHNTAYCDPIITCQLSKKQIEECEKNENISLKNEIPNFEQTQKKNNSKKYIGKFQRKKFPNMIAWILKQNPKADLVLIAKLLHSRIDFVKRISERVKEIEDLVKPTNLGIGTELELQAIIYPN